MNNIVMSYTVPATGKWAQALHDYQCDKWGYEPRQPKGYRGGLPETIPAAKNQNGAFYPLSREWQTWWFELLRRANYGMYTDSQLKTRWTALTKNGVAWTDDHAWDNGFCDYIQGVNIGANPMALKALWNGGNVGKVLNERGRLLTLECLNFSKSPPPIADVWEKRPWLYFWASSATWIKLQNKTYIVTPFPQMSPCGCPIPFGSDTGEWLVTKDYAKVIKNGSTVRIYNP